MQLELLRRRCARCKHRKPLWQFHRNQRYCKLCKRIKGADWRRKNRDRVREHARQRYHRQRASRRRRDAARRRDPAQRKKIQARQALNNAIARGELERPAVCARCGDEGRIQGHHHDYDRPLDVEWLCGPCHAIVDDLYAPLPTPETGSGHAGRIRKTARRFR